MRGNWIEFACLLLTDLEDKNQGSLFESGLLPNYRLLSTGYGTFRSCDGCRKLFVYEPGEPVVPRYPGPLRRFEGVDHSLGERGTNLLRPFSGVHCQGPIMTPPGSVSQRQVNTKSTPKEKKWGGNWQEVSSRRD